MARKRTLHAPAFKAKVALEALKGAKTINQLATDFEIYPNQIVTWKKLAQEGLECVFSSKRERDKVDQEAHEAALYEEIGRLKFELNWLKKN